MDFTQYDGFLKVALICVSFYMLGIFLLITYVIVKRNRGVIYHVKSLVKNQDKAEIYLYKNGKKTSFIIQNVPDEEKIITEKPVKNGKIPSAQIPFYLDNQITQ